MLYAVSAVSQVCLILFLDLPCRLILPVAYGNHKKDSKKTAKLKILTQLLLSTKKEMSFEVQCIKTTCTC